MLIGVEGSCGSVQSVSDTEDIMTGMARMTAISSGVLLLSQGLLRQDNDIEFPQITLVRFS